MEEEGTAVCLGWGSILLGGGPLSSSPSVSSANKDLQSQNVPTFSLTFCCAFALLIDFCYLGIT